MLLARVRSSRPPFQICYDDMDEVTASARFARLYGICRRLRWSDYGVPARESPEAKQALEDLCEYLFMDGVDAALAAPPVGEP